MDLQKTGNLIAQRRKTLNLTQKELANRLSISDRTVSKWERGVGFPDISLLEPLADALELSVLDLMHGELSVVSTPAAEDTARRTLHSVGEVVEQRIKKARGWLCVLGVLLVLALGLIIFLLTYPDKYYMVSQETISAAKATQICPSVLITTEEYDLREAILADEAITSVLDDDAIMTVDEMLSAPYAALLPVPEDSADTFSIEIIGQNVYVCYYSPTYRCTLSFSPHYGVEKCCAAYRHDGSVEYALINENNETFYLADESRDLLGPWKNW